MQIGKFQNWIIIALKGYHKVMVTKDFLSVATLKHDMILLEKMTASNFTANFVHINFRNYNIKLWRSITKTKDFGCLREFFKEQNMSKIGQYTQLASELCVCRKRNKQKVKQVVHISMRCRNVINRYLSSIVGNVKCTHKQLGPMYIDCKTGIEKYNIPCITLINNKMKNQWPLGRGIIHYDIS